MTEKVPGWLERVLLPRLSEIAGEVKAINVKIDAVDGKLTSRIDAVEGKLASRIDAVDEKLSARIDAVDEKLSSRIDVVDGKLSGKIDDLDKRLDVAQRLAILETKMGELQPKP